MPNLLVAGKLHPSGEAMLRDLPALGFSVRYIEDVSEASYAPFIAHSRFRQPPLPGPDG